MGTILSIREQTVIKVKSMIGAKASMQATTSRKATSSVTKSFAQKGKTTAANTRAKAQLMGSTKSNFVARQGLNMQALASKQTKRNTKLAARAEVGDTLEEFLEKNTDDLKLRQLMLSMGEAVRTIAYKVRTASCSATACINSFGDEQLAVDLLADKILFETLKFSVGTIFGVWPGGKLTGITGRDQAAAAMGVYGPRTVYCLALKDCPGCHEFLLQDDGKFIHVKETTEIAEGKMFSPGNLRATFDNPEYAKLVNYWIDNQYTLRYTGGMVPDVFQIIAKEKGVFSNVISPTTKAKLRLLFEVAPLALLVEK